MVRLLIIALCISFALGLNAGDNVYPMDVHAVNTDVHDGGFAVVADSIAKPFSSEDMAILNEKLSKYEITTTTKRAIYDEIYGGYGLSIYMPNTDGLHELRYIVSHDLNKIFLNDGEVYRALNEGVLGRNNYIINVSDSDRSFLLKLFSGSDKDSHYSGIDAVIRKDQTKYPNVDNSDVVGEVAKAPRLLILSGTIIKIVNDTTVQEVVKNYKVIERCFNTESSQHSNFIFGFSSHQTSIIFIPFGQDFLAAARINDFNCDILLMERKGIGDHMYLKNNSLFRLITDLSDEDKRTIRNVIRTGPTIGEYFELGSRQ